MPDLVIHCPICDKKNTISINENSIKDAARGLIAVSITAGMICEHQFIAYLDKNLKVRDCLTADFHIDIPISPEKESQKIKTDVIDMDIINMNLTPQTIIYMIKGILSKKKIVLISDVDFLYNHFMNFFKYITTESFEIDITVLTIENYMNQKQNFPKDVIVIGKNEVLKDERGIFVNKKLKHEKAMVDAFLNEEDLKVSMIILKNEFKKVFDISKALADFIKSENIKEVNIKQFIAHLKKNFKLKANAEYVNFLLDIVELYFNVDFSRKSDVSDFLATL